MSGKNFLDRLDFNSQTCVTYYGIYFKAYPLRFNFLALEPQRINTSPYSDIRR